MENALSLKKKNNPHNTHPNHASVMHDMTFILKMRIMYWIHISENVYVIYLAECYQ